VAEYRLDPNTFDILLHLIGPSLEVNERQARNAMGKSGSAPISTASRIGAALIMLGGGRRIESMRTHGIAESTAYKNLKNRNRSSNRRSFASTWILNDVKGIHLSDLVKDTLGQWFPGLTDWKTKDFSNFFQVSQVNTSNLSIAGHPFNPPSL
jgi:hypothetical protein